MTKTIKYFVVMPVISSLLLAISTALTACSNGQVEQGSGYTPKVGEYGKELVTSVKLTPEQIDLLNSDNLPQPYNQLTDEQKLIFEFPASNELNPYRVVILTHGSAKRNGEVNVQFLGMIKRASAKPEDLSKVQLYREEDSNDYRVSQKLVLAVNSEPFSFPLDTLNDTYRIQAGLTRRDNFQFESVDIQVWQGVGEKRSKYSYYKLFIMIMIAGFVFYRMFFARL